MDSPLPRSLVASYLQPMAPIPTSMKARGALEAPIQCLLCDIYGTLLISGSGDLGVAPVEQPAMAGLRELLARYGFDISPEALLERLRRTVAESHAHARKQGVDFPEVRIEEIWRALWPLADAGVIRRFAVEFELVVNPVWPMPHLTEMLAACRERNLRLGIVSNAQFFTPVLFEWLLGASLGELGFDASLIVLSYRHGVAKPSDRLFQKVLRQLRAAGIAPRRTAYIGNDMRKDIVPAARAGFQTVLFAGDARSLRLEGRLGSAGEAMPDLVVTDLRELISFLC